MFRLRRMGIDTLSEHRLLVESTYGDREHDDRRVTDDFAEASSGARPERSQAKAPAGTVRATAIRSGGR